jgi:hypothetical protein
LNLLNGFHLAIAKLLTKFDEIPLLESFYHFRRMRRALCIHSLSHAGCTPTYAVCLRENCTYAYEGTLHLSTTAHLPCFNSFRGKKSRHILLEQPSYISLSRNDVKIRREDMSFC